MRALSRMRRAVRAALDAVPTLTLAMVLLFLVAIVLPPPRDVARFPAAIVRG